MSVSAVGAADPAAAATAATAATKAQAKASGDLTFDEIFKLAMLPRDTGDLSGQAKSLVQDKGIASALALLGD